MIDAAMDNKKRIANHGQPAELKKNRQPEVRQEYIHIHHRITAYLHLFSFVVRY